VSIDPEDFEYAVVARFPQAPRRLTTVQTAARRIEASELRETETVRQRRRVLTIAEADKALFRTARYARTMRRALQLSSRR